QVVSTGGPAQHLQVPGFGRDLLVPLLGDFQRSNCGLAVAMLLALRGQGLQSSCGALQDVLDDGTITEGIAATRWPGRLEWVETHDLRLLVDGAHNPHAARALGRFVETLRPQPITWACESFVRLAPRGRRRRCALRGRQLSEEDFRELLERPEGAKDLQEILKEMLQDKKTLKESNATFQELMAAQSGAENADPLARGAQGRPLSLGNGKG
ncbi:unnamed protein product, partial [Effrenium voratum]